MGLILDTSILIDTERGRFDMPAFLQSLGEESVAISAITASELLFGVERATDPGQRARRGAFVEAVLESIPAIPFDLAEARRHAQIWEVLSRLGARIGPHDLLVAATALAHDRAVATLNVGEFERVPGLTLAETSDFRISARRKRGKGKKP